MGFVYSNCSTITANTGCIMYSSSALTSPIAASVLSDGVKCYTTDVNGQVISIGDCSGGGSPVPPLNSFDVYLSSGSPSCLGTLRTIFTSSNASSLATALVGDIIFRYPQGTPITGFNYIVEITGGFIYNLNTTSAELGASTGVAC